VSTTARDRWPRGGRPPRPHPAARGRVADLRRHSAEDTARIGRNSRRSSNPPPTGRPAGRSSGRRSPHQCAEPDRALLRHAFRAVRTAGERPLHLASTPGKPSPWRSSGSAASSCGGPRRRGAPRTARAPGYVPPTGGTRCTSRVRIAIAQALAPAAGGARRASGRRRLVWLARKVQEGPPRLH
jgi:hypothetical protein